jgi:N-acetylmuramoyl-L-alanine amidase/V8-like Glu-specific endopeptidase
MARATRIIIDAGHGGSERAGNSSAYGARGPSGVVEKDVTLDIAKHVVARLGGQAALTRTGDRNLTIGARAAQGQRSDVFVSIHANYGAPELSGPEVYVHPEAGRGSRALAGRIARALDRQAGRYGGGSEERRAAMAVLNPSAVGRTAACLVEVDYLSNQRGEQRLGDPRERAAIGAAIASAIQEHLASGLSWDLAEAIRTIEPALDETSLSSHQKRRLHDLLRILRDNPNADDRYVNGLDNELQRIGPQLTPEQFDVMTRNRVTTDLLRQSDWDSPAHIAESLRLLDERIWHGIQYLARRAATDGAVMPAGLLQLKDWISERQRDPRSIYYAYGELQNRYEGRYGKQLDLNAGRTVESGSLTLQPGLPGHAQLILSSAHNGGTLLLEGTVSWSAGAPPRAITARFVDLASQGLAGTDHALRVPSTPDVAVPLTGADGAALEWQVPVNPGPARIELEVESSDPETRVSVEWRAVVTPPRLIPPEPAPFGSGRYGYVGDGRRTIRGSAREQIAFLVSIEDWQNRIHLGGYARLIDGPERRLVARLVDTSAPDQSIGPTQHLELVSDSAVPLRFAWPPTRQVGQYAVQLWVESPSPSTRVDLDYTLSLHNYGGGSSYGQQHAHALDRSSPDPFLIPSPSDYVGTNLRNYVAVWRNWFSRYTAWRAGVPTAAYSTFPHNAIAELEITLTNGRTAFATGFYVGPNKLLTNGHVFMFGSNRAASIRVRLGKQPGVAGTTGGTTFTIRAPASHCHPRWAARNEAGFDIAVLRTPGVSPAQFFQLPNLCPSAEEDMVVCGYAKFTRDRVPLAQQGQYMDGDRITGTDGELCFFPIQSLPGGSGSPVFWPSHNGMVIAVFSGPRVALTPSGPEMHPRENRGVLLTPDKNAWIESM